MKINEIKLDNNERLNNNKIHKEKMKSLNIENMAEIKAKEEENKLKQEIKFK